eukprot:TRINITY_DN5240_c0_g1_i17.p1 TRINITY_DN5240_c0_g1~~TRINITY_DN5240_c0_g1_i17.p1  ORF type:complete len:181 (+),score=23.21 TRINITY_DN5240_c0_g1_i17:94-636(+)
MFQIPKLKASSRQDDSNSPFETTCYAFAIVQVVITLLCSVVNMPMIIIMFLSGAHLMFALSLLLSILKVACMSAWFIITMKKVLDDQRQKWTLVAISGIVTTIMAFALVFFVKALTENGRTMSEAFVHPGVIDLLSFVPAGISITFLAITKEVKAGYEAAYWPVSYKVNGPVWYPLTPYV